MREQKKGGAIKLKKAMYGSSMMKKGGATKKYGPGGPTGPGDDKNSRKTTRSINKYEKEYKAIR